MFTVAGDSDDARELFFVAAFQQDAHGFFEFGVFPCVNEWIESRTAESEAEHRFVNCQRDTVPVAGGLGARYGEEWEPAGGETAHNQKHDLKHSIVSDNWIFDKWKERAVPEVDGKIG